MITENWKEKKLSEVLAKYRLLFVLVGAIVAVIAFFVPMFHLERYEGEPLNRWIRASLWIFGLYEDNANIYTIGWFGGYYFSEEAKLTLALFSITVTIMVALLVLTTVLLAGKALVKERGKVAKPSRMFLYLSTSLFTVINLYIFVLSIIGRFENFEFGWIIGLFEWIPTSYPSSFIRLGAILFYIGSIFILLGYTLKLKPFLKILSLYIAGAFIIYGGLLFAEIYYWFPVFPEHPLQIESFQRIFNSIGIPALIALVCALAIIIVNIVFYIRRKEPIPIR
jgi:hypothetical protein